MEWMIVTDSGCDLLPGDLAPNVGLRRVPLSILLGDQEWVDDAGMDRDRFLAAMEAHKIAASRPANVLFILLRPFYILSMIDGFRAWIHLLPFHTRPLPAPCRT